MSKKKKSFAEMKKEAISKKQERWPQAIQQVDEKSEFKVSAIVSTYNSERFIKGCLEDLVIQTLYYKSQLEIVVVDSGSQQNEKIIVQGYQQKYPNIVYIRTEERESLYGAWNRGIKIARGEYITNANTDDRHRRDALEVLCNALDNNHGIQLVYGNCYLSFIPNQTYDENPKSRIFRYPKYFAPSSLLHFQFGPQPMWRRELHDRIGYFDDNYHAAGDFDFNIRFTLNCDALHVSEILGLYLAQPEAITFRDEIATEECTRVVVTYRTSNYIIKLYQNAGIPCDSLSEKALVLLDMGIRAMEYYTPWKEGLPSQDIGFAMQCFYWSAELFPTCLANYNNIAIALYLRNERYAALNLLNDISKLGHDVTVTHNLRLLAQDNLQPNFPNDLKLIKSGLQFPSQKELYFD